ncbi:MAG: molybdopterin biosynthesis protein [Geminicoccaceae bacterium]
MAAQTWQDVRRTGFAGRVELDRARATLEGLLPEPSMELAPLEAAVGRVAAKSGIAPIDLPLSPLARVDGYALAAASTYGAGNYNPIEVLEGGLHEVTTGAPMPSGSDSVLGYGATTGTGGLIEILEPVAAGEGVTPAGGLWSNGAVVFPAGRRLDTLDVARAAEAELMEIAVWRRPRVALLIAGAKPRRTALNPVENLLQGLVARDGGADDRTRATLDTLGEIDLVIMAGRSGCGSDDDAAPRIAARGRVLWHGLAIAPGSTSGLGVVDDVPVILLPGEPLACLAAYELLAGPALRRLAGLDPALPHARTSHRLATKIASRPGTVELWLVGAQGAAAQPLAHPDLATLAATREAIGFVIVPASSEGYPAGAEVEVHLFAGHHG